MLTYLFLILIMAFIVVGTTRWKIHPFLSLLIAALAMGFFDGLDGATIMSTLTTSFGNTLKSIGIVIAFGTIIGTFLERNGAQHPLLNRFLNWWVRSDPHL